MKPKEFLKGEISEVEHCATRAMCPLGLICGVTRNGDMPPLFPTITSIGKGEMLWTNLRFENRIFIIHDGVFVTIGHTEQENEVPFALFGKGVAIGIGELYAPEELGGSYYVRNLLPGRVCSVPGNPVKARLESMQNPYSQKVLSCALLNQSTSAFTLSKIIAKRALYDRILALLLYLRDLTGRTGKEMSTFGITHEEIAMLVHSDRVSTTRVLHKMRDDGLIDIGYKSITLHIDEVGAVEELAAHTNFLMLEERGRPATGRDRRFGDDAEELAYIYL